MARHLGSTARVRFKPSKWLGKSRLRLARFKLLQVVMTASASRALLAAARVAVALASLAAATAWLASPLTALAEPKASERDWTSAAAEGCALFGADASRLDSRSCSGCHRMVDHGHPVESDYEQARFRSPSGRDLRPVQEVAKRGVRLVGGKVTCVTCHDAASRFGSHLAIPQNALVRPAANLADPATFENPAPPRPVALVRSGTQVSPKPLCLSCHAID